MPAHRVALAVPQHGQQQASGMLAGLVHVDVRIGLEAHDHVGVGDHPGGDVAVQVERHADRHAGRGRTQSFEQVAFAVGAVLGHHRAVQVQQDGIAAGRGLDDAARQFVIGGGMHSTARVGGGRHGRDRRRAQAVRQVDEGRHGRAHALLLAQGRLAIGRGERLQRRRHGREGVGLVVEPGDQETHRHAATSALRSMPCSSTLQPASRCSGRASSISL